MNLAMQQPMPYPFYMGSPRYPYSVPWSPNPHHFPSPSYQTPPSLSHMPYPLPFVLSHQPRQNLPPRPLQTFSSYTNTRYNHLKQSTSHINRHRSIDTSFQTQRYSIPNHQYRPLKTKSVSDFQQLSQQNSTHLFKAHSWHSMNHLHQVNSNVNYTKPIPLIHENHHNHHHHHHRQHSPKRKKKSHRRQLSSSSTQMSEQNIVRISTLDEMPIMNNPIYTDNLSNSKIKKSNKQSSPSSTASSHSSFQKRLNGSLRNDPLIIAAMEDFRQLNRTPSQSTILTPHQRDLSRDSLCSNSIDHLSSSSSSSSSASSLSRNHSQSSFTSLERLEIRNLIKTLKTKGLQTIENSIQIPSNPPSLLSKKGSIKKPPSLISINKPKKSSITEELDREFNKLRSSNPNQDIIYVKPSLIQKQKQSIPSLPTFDELLQKVEIQKCKEIDEKPYENPLPQNSPIPSPKLELNEKLKPEYAIPIRKLSEVNLRPAKLDEQIRSFSFCKPINDIITESTPTRPLSMFNWLQYGLTNPLPTTFQPTRNENEYEKSLVKENIYASDIDIHLPLSNEKDYLNNQTLMTDYLSDYKQSTINNSILNDFSRLFTRFGNHKHEQKTKLKTKLHKNNQNLRCSIM